jgi:hypothetical protein
MHRQQSLPVANSEPTFEASANIGEVTGVTKMAKKASHDHILPVSKLLSFKHSKLCRFLNEYVQSDLFLRKKAKNTKTGRKRMKQSSEMELQAKQAERTTWSVG